MTDKSIGQNVDAYFSANLRTVREYREMSQAALARAMAGRSHPWHQQTVARVEAGRQQVGISEAADLADILGVTTDRLMWPPAEAGEVALVDRAIAMIREAWHETSDATVRLQSSLKAGERMLESAKKSKYERARQAAEELETEIAQSSPEIALSDGLARYEDPEE